MGAGRLYRLLKKPSKNYSLALKNAWGDGVGEVGGEDVKWKKWSWSKKKKNKISEIIFNMGEWKEKDGLCIKDYAGWVMKGNIVKGLANKVY